MTPHTTQAGQTQFSQWTVCSFYRATEHMLLHFRSIGGADMQCFLVFERTAAISCKWWREGWGIRGAQLDSQIYSSSIFSYFNLHILWSFVHIIKICHSFAQIANSLPHSCKWLCTNICCFISCLHHVDQNVLHCLSDGWVLHPYEVMGVP